MNVVKKGSLLCIYLLVPFFAYPNASALKPYSLETLLVRFKPGSHEQFMAGETDNFGSVALTKYSIVSDLYLMHLPANVSVEQALAWYQNQQEVVYAEPDYSTRDPRNAQKADLDPKTIDPHFYSQWALNNTGQNGGTADSDINAVESWAITEGSKEPVIGIIDSGVDYNHTDLNANLWQNTMEIPGNGIDDDANGYIDDIYGINAITGSGNPLDDFHHGTRVAGIIGGVANNEIGISGVMNSASIASCKFLGSTGIGNASDAIECMQYFSQLKTRFYSPENIVAINNSWILNAKSEAIEDAIITLRSHGIVFVAAAGNTGTNNDTVVSYPANYPVSNVISVAASDRNDIKPVFSNYGKATVHVAAPGSNIISTVPNQNYSTSSGTSLAAPHVTGLIGLLASHDSGLSWSQLKNLAIAGGEAVPAFENNTISSRRIRGADESGVGSLTCENQIVLGRMAPLEANVFVATESPVLLKALHIVCDSPNGDVTVYDDGNTEVVLKDGGIEGDDYAEDGVYSLNWIPNLPGDYALDYGNGDTIDVRVYDPTSWNNYNVSIDGSFTAENFVGTSLGAGDEAIYILTSPFPIHLGGDISGFTTLYISSNGTISLTDPKAFGGINANLADADRSTLIAPFWDDLTFTATGAAIYYQVLGSAPNRKLVVEWRNFKHFNTSGSGTFQVIFYEGSSNFRFAYKDTDLGSPLYNSGKSATVGVQMSPTLYKLHSYLQSQVPSNRSLLFTLQP